MLNKKVMTMKILTLLTVILVLSGCGQDDVRVANHNLARAADNFEVNRRIVFYNTWTDQIVQQVEGLCSIDYGTRVSVTCKIGADKYTRSFISLSGQVTVFVEQLEPLPVNTYHYRRVFKPQTIIPDIDIRFSGSALNQALSLD